MSHFTLLQAKPIKFQSFNDIHKKKTQQPDSFYRGPFRDTDSEIKNSETNIEILNISLLTQSVYGLFLCIV